MGWNQLCNGDTVTVQNGHKYVMKKSGTVSLGASTGTAITGLTSGTDTVTDLTLLLGSTIADHIYSLETATSGAGIAKLREWGFISDAYIPYDAGSIESVKASAKVTRDASDNIIGNYPLDSSLTLRGIPKLTDGKLWYDGDRYLPDGMVERRYGVYVCTGQESLTTQQTLTNNKYISFALPNAKNLPGVFSSDFVTDMGVTYSNNINNDVSYGAFRRNTIFYVSFPVGMTTAEMQAWISGKTIVYELATPTTEQGDPFPSPQIVDPDGTEEYVTSNGVPVGHETRYQL